MNFSSDKLAVHRIVNGKLKENCYLVLDQASQEIAIIDPGGDAEAIIANIRSMGGTPRYILITHGHYDHMGAASELENLTDLPCLVHEDDISLLRRAPLYGLAIENKTVVSPKSVKSLTNGKTLSLGKSTIEVWPTPGHTQGSVCFKVGPILFTGDTLLKNKIGPTIFPGSHSEKIIASVESIISSLPTGSMILPGHGSSWKQESALTWWKESSSDRKSLPNYAEGVESSP